MSKYANQGYKIKYNTKLEDGTYMTTIEVMQKIGSTYNQSLALIQKHLRGEITDSQLLAQAPVPKQSDHVNWGGLSNKPRDQNLKKITHPTRLDMKYGWE